MSNSINFNANIAVDSSNDPVSGAVATFFDTGTSNAQTVYTDKALSVGVTSLTADSGGLFAMIYSNDTTDLKVVVKTSAGATLYTVDPAVVQSTGGGASTVSFTPTARISDSNVQAAIEKVDSFAAQLEKDVRTVYATAGSSNAYTVVVTGVTAYTSGDVYLIRANRVNTGAATLNFEGVGAKSWQYYDATGTLVEYTANQIRNGVEFKVVYDGTQFVTLFDRSPPSLEFIERKVLSSDATADFTGFDATKYDSYVLELGNVIPATDAVELRAKVSTDGGSTYDGGTNYATNFESMGASGKQAIRSAAGVYFLGSGTNTAASNANDVVGSAANEDGVSGTFTIYSPGLVKNTHITFLLSYESAETVHLAAWGSGYHTGGNAVDGFQLYFSSGNLESGTITLYGRTNG